MCWSIVALLVSPWTLGCAAVLFAYAWYKLHKVYSYFKVRGIPYLKPVPYFGNMAAVLFRRRTFMDQVRMEYKQMEGER